MTGPRKALLATSCIVCAGLALSSAATQFVASRVGYHPMLGHPWAGHFYAPWSWVEWMKAPWAAQAKHTFAFVQLGLMGTAVAALGMGSAAVQGRRRPMKHTDVHGSARFIEDEDELVRTRLLGKSGAFGRLGKQPEGVYVGGWTDKKGRVRYLRHDGPEHCIVIAPTRSGKGVGNILPTLLSWPASTLVYDEKGELWALTAGWRAQSGNTVIRWEPGAIGEVASFNFLEEVRIGTPFEVSDAQNIAQAICDPKGEGLESKDHWTKGTFALFGGLILYVLYAARAEGRVGSLSDMARMLKDPEQEANALWEAMLNHDNLTVAEQGRAMLARPEKERGSMLSTADLYMTLFSDPIIGGNTARSDFRLRDLMNAKNPVSLYIVTRGADKERLRPLVRLLLTMAMRDLMGVELSYVNGQAVMPHKHRLLAMLDEFPSLKEMEVVEGSLPKCAGYGIKFFLAAQNREQIFKAYGPNQSVTGNCHVRIVYAPNESATADFISHEIGDTTIIKEDVTESGLKSGSLRNVSRTYHEVKRPLLTPDEVMALRKPRKDEQDQITESGEMLIFMAGERPIKGTQILYFIDETFSARSRIPAPPSQSLTRDAALRWAA